MKPEIKYGLAGGVAVCLWSALAQALGFHTTRPEMGRYSDLLANLIPITALFGLLRAKRAKIYDGRLSLASGIGAGLYSSVIAAMIVYIFLVTYTHFINPTWIYQVLEVKVAAWRAQQVPEAGIQARIIAYRDAYAPDQLALNIILGRTLIGGVCALGLTLLVRQLPHRPT